jgi:hypothetical protein
MVVGQVDPILLFWTELAYQISVLVLGLTLLWVGGGGGGRAGGLNFSLSYFS